MKNQTKKQLDVKKVLNSEQIPKKIFTIFLVVFSGLMAISAAFNLLKPPFIRTQTLYCPPSTPHIGGFESTDPGGTVSKHAGIPAIFTMSLILVAGIYLTYYLIRPHTKYHLLLIFCIVTALWIIQIVLVVANSVLCL